MEEFSRMVFRATPIVTCLLFLPLMYAAFFGSNDIAFDRWMRPYSKSKFSPGKVNEAVEEHESLKFLLRRLVRGDDRSKLETTGFACDTAVHSVVCVSNQPVRIETDTMTIHVPSTQTIPQNETVVQPYARQEDKDLLKFITPVHILQEKMTKPACHYTHNLPTIIFSSGVIGNIFHEINDIIIPLFITSHHFRSNVRFILVDYNPLFVHKYNRIFSRLSHYDIINPGSNKSVDCFPGVVVGLKYHDNLALNSSYIPGGYSMLDFKQFLRESYNLKIKNVKEIQRPRPVLLLISRRKTRMFLNEEEMVGMMEELGFEVTITKTGNMSNLDNFANVVNSCSVMVGAHGAGLTNQVFLPTGAVLVQVVPLALTWASDTYYGEPTKQMGLKYLEYKTVPEESSLINKYGPNHPVIADPASVFSKGYSAARAMYIDGQNMTINLLRFRATLVEALVHLEYSAPSN